MLHSSLLGGLDGWNKQTAKIHINEVLLPDPERSGEATKRNGDKADRRKSAPCEDTSTASVAGFSMASW